jgi:hypothetical protein
MDIVVGKIRPTKDERAQKKSFYKEGKNRIEEKRICTQTTTLCR